MSSAYFFVCFWGWQTLLICEVTAQMSLLSGDDPTSSLRTTKWNPFLFLSSLFCPHIGHSS